MNQIDDFTDTPISQLDDSISQTKSRGIVRLMLFLLLFIGVTLGSFAVWFYWGQLPPTTFDPQTITITPGERPVAIAEDLAAAGVVRSEYVLLLILRFIEDPTAVKASTYEFTEAVSAFAVARQLVTGDFDSNLVALTFVEGETATTYGIQAAEQLPNVERDRWNELTTDQEGRLFPNTYRVPPEFTTTDLIQLLQTEHETVLAELYALYPSDLATSTVVTLASIVEREANTPESMRTVAGILLNRLAIGMPLQADATIEYVLEDPLHELPPGQLAVALREVESPYNTYKNLGLPPTPIANPGRQALAAILNPVKSDYLYYITGRDGDFYYATTYAQHQRNIETHLR